MRDEDYDRPDVNALLKKHAELAAEFEKRILGRMPTPDEQREYQRKTIEISREIERMRKIKPKR